MNREQMQSAVDEGRADWLDETTIQYKRFVEIDWAIVEEPGAVVRLVNVP